MIINNITLEAEHPTDPMLILTFYGTGGEKKVYTGAEAEEVMGLIEDLIEDEPWKKNNQRGVKADGVLP